MKPIETEPKIASIFHAHVSVLKVWSVRNAKSLFLAVAVILLLILDFLVIAPWPGNRSSIVGLQIQLDCPKDLMERIKPAIVLEDSGTRNLRLLVAFPLRQEMEKRCTKVRIDLPTTVSKAAYYRSEHGSSPIWPFHSSNFERISIEVAPLNEQALSFIRGAALVMRFEEMDKFQGTFEFELPSFIQYVGLSKRQILLPFFTFTGSREDLDSYAIDQKRISQFDVLFVSDREVNIEAAYPPLSNFELFGSHYIYFVDGHKMSRGDLLIRFELIWLRFWENVILVTTSLLLGYTVAKFGDIIWNTGNSNSD